MISIPRSQKAQQQQMGQEPEAHDDHILGYYSKYVILKEVVLMAIKFLIEILLSFTRIFRRANLKKIENEIVLITGAGHGIGKELALLYCKHKCRVICVDIHEDNNKETVRIANESRFGSAFAYQCDITNRAAVNKLAEQISKEIGNVTVIVNNAGIMPSHPLEQHTEVEIRQIFNVNVMSHFWILESFMPQMEMQRRGHIIAISSVAGFCGLTNLIPYCASKFAVRGLMEALHEEIREGPNREFIKTTIIYPYMVDTGLCKKPKMRFPNLLGFLTPKRVAVAVVDAHRQNLKEVSLPKSLLYVNNILRCLPLKCAEIFKDFMDTGVESDL